MKLVVLLIILTACSADVLAATTSTEASPSSTTTTTSTTSTTTPAEPIPMTGLRLIDPATLSPATQNVQIPGQPWEEPSVLPDGRFFVFSGNGPEPNQQWLSTIDFTKGVAESIEISFSPAQTLGYSEATKRVVLLVTSGDGTQMVLIDPNDLSIVEQPELENAGGEWWPFQAELFDGGRKLAFYSAVAYNEEQVGEPPQVRVLDLETNVLADPIDIEGAVHGLAELSEEFIRYPNFPYGEVELGIAFDSVDGRLFAAHADGKGLTVVDLVSREVDVVSLKTQPSFWGRALSWLIPPAEAKGSEPSATISAWLSPDRRFLYVTGEADDAWRDSDNRLHTTTAPLGLMVVDTQSLELVHSLELPVSRGLSTDNGVAVTGTTNNQIWCDEECKPGNNEPEVEGSGEATGLYILDPETLDIREQLQPGVFFYYMQSFEDWIISESDISESWGYHSINTRTGEVSPFKSATGTSSLMVTDGGIVEVEWPEVDW
jgi:hypothetical protein